jgi:uncharacterized membrane protein
MSLNLPHAVARLRALATGAHPATWMVIAAAGAYAVLFTDLSLLKLETFHATFGDLGLENHILWLLSHGGFATYNDSGFATVYAFNYQKPIALLVLPFYALDPQLSFLLTLQSFILGLAALPLYFFARDRTKSAWTGGLVALTYLAYFPVASANLFDFHYEAFTPLFFFLLLLSWERGWRRAMYLSCLLCASINPLPLVMMVLFLLYLPLEGYRLERPAIPFARDYLRRLSSDPARVGMLVLLLGLLGLYKVIGSLPLAGVGGAAAGLTPTGILLFDVNAKLSLFLLLFGALAFLPLFDRMGLVLLLPYVGFAFYSANSANWQAFGLAYTTLAIGPLYLGLVNVLARHLDERRIVNAALSVPVVGLSDADRRRYRRGSRMSDPRVVAAAVAVVFTLVYFPISPLNAYVAGGYFSGNHDLAGITTVTPESRFLQQVVTLIPPNGAVLTQNDIPQVSGREYYQVDQYYTSATPYDYILMDSAESYFTSQSSILPFVEPALANGSFGVLAEGMGALLLERGYHGSPVLFVPLQGHYDATSLSALDPTDVQGTHVVGTGPSFSLWYGPFIQLYPGNYSVDFALQTNRSGPPAVPELTIDVTSDKGSVTLSTQTLYSTNFTQNATTQIFELTFHVASIAANVEFRGMSPTGQANLQLDGIWVNQTSAT